MHRFLFAALLTLAGAGALLAGASAASAQTYTCTCDRYGDIANGTAIPGAATAGTVVRGVSRDRSDHPNCQWRLGLTVH